MKRFKNQIEITELVRAFENCTIEREEWKHAEHLTVALFYLSENEFETAYVKMREGIFKLLRAFEVDLIKEMPYHETLTTFWLRTVDNFRNSKSDYSIVEICNEIIEKFDKDYPLKFYSRERLFSDEARVKFVEADLED